MAPRLMILGGGSSQIEAFRRARREGFFTVLADRNPEAPARRLADAFAPASTFDVDAVTAAAREHRVDALLAIGTDQPVLTAARVSAALGLPFPLSPEQALLLTNKAPMKRRFAAAGIPSAPWALLGRDEAAWDAEGLAELTPPWVAKPVDSQGQRGIAVVRSRDELRTHLPHLLRHSREETVLVEEYYPSREVTVSGWVDESGTPEIWTITDRVTFADERRIGVCLAHRYPSLHVRPGQRPSARVGATGASSTSDAPATSDAADMTATAGTSDASATSNASDTTGTASTSGTFDTTLAAAASSRADVSDTVRTLTRRVVNAFELANGPIYFQMLIGERGVLVNEIAFRLGGAYEDQSIPLVTGIDILGRQLDSIRRAVGEWSRGPTPGEYPSGTAVARCFVVPLMFCRPGTIVALEGDAQMRSIPGVVACHFLLPVGTTIRPMADSTQRIAYAVLHGPDAAAVNRLVDTLFDTLRVVDPEGRNLLIDTREATKLVE
jgi:biotin carboxylase